MKHYYHLSHTDLDGFSCQLVMHFSEYENHFSFFNANYGAEVSEKLHVILETIKKTEDSSYILISDLNLTLDESKWLDREVTKLNGGGIEVTLQLLDHHGSGKECAESYAWYHLDTSKSATLLVYTYAKEHLHLEEPSWLQEYVHAVNAVDLWKQEEHNYFEYGKVCMRLISESRELNRITFPDEDRNYKLYLLEQAGKMFTHDDAHITLDESFFMMKKNYFKEEKNDTLDNLLTASIVELLSHKFDEMTIYYKGYKGFLTCSIGNISIIGNAFLKTNSDYDFIVDVSSRGALSFRANNTVDVSLMAKEFACGGGHPNAAGCRLQQFKESYRYDEIKKQLQTLIEEKEKSGVYLDPKRED